MDPGDERHIVDRLIRIEVLIETRLSDLNSRLQDHEVRLRASERWRYALPLAAIATAASAGLAIFSALGR